MDLIDKAKNIFSWSVVQYKICERIENNPSIYNATIPMFSIYTCHLGENIGDEKNGIGRPVIILSSNIIFKNNRNIIIAPLSKNIKWDGNSTKKVLRYKQHYVLYKLKYPKLGYDSVIQFEDIRSINKSRLGKYICQVNDVMDIKGIKDRIKYMFGV